MAEETTGSDADKASTSEDDLLDEQADAAEDFLNDLLDAIGIEGEAVADIDGDYIYVDVEGEDMGLLIGRAGQTLEALQDLVKAAVSHKTNAPARLNLDIEGYRDRQEERLEQDARRAADRALRDRAAVHMDPMNSYERRIVHEAVRDIDGIMTRSEGEEPDRHVVILPA